MCNNFYNSYVACSKVLNYVINDGVNRWTKNCHRRWSELMDEELSTEAGSSHCCMNIISKRWTQKGTLCYLNKDKDSDRTLPHSPIDTVISV